MFHENNREDPQSESTANQEKEGEYKYKQSTDSELTSSFLHSRYSDSYKMTQQHESKHVETTITVVI